MLDEVPFIGDTVGHLDSKQSLLYQGNLVVCGYINLESMRKARDGTLNLKFTGPCYRI